MSEFASSVVETVRRVVGPGRVGLHEPEILEEDTATVLKCLESGYVSSVGEWVVKFEEALAKFTGSSFVVAVSSGTSALQLALRTAGVLAGDEVLVPALSFVATANSVSYLGAIPHFVDIEPESLGMDPVALRTYLKQSTVPTKEGTLNKDTGRIVKAVVPMHCFGHPARIGELIEVAREFDLALIEDAAEGLGSLSGGRHVGTFGTFGTLSFNGNKTLTTGGGGALLTDNKELALQAKHLSTTAKVPHEWDFDHDEIGYNFRMPNLNAALGWSQMQRLGKTLERKRRLADDYIESFEGFGDISLIREPEGAKSNYWLNTLLLATGRENEAVEILRLGHESQLLLRPAWKLLHQLTPYRKSPRSTLEQAESIQPRLINLPSSAFLPNLES